VKVILPDPHPGRCRNHRDGRRCLDYDHRPHVCEFPEPPPSPTTTSFHITYTRGVIEPWVKPGDEAQP
jgi:hypothetical protein